MHYISTSRHEMRRWSIMKYFPVIESLCRIGLATDNVAFRHQVERLRKSLIAENESDEAASLDRLLRATARQKAMAPSKLIASGRAPGVEELSAKVQPPIDRETGAALAEIFFVDARSISAPVLPEQLVSVVSSLIIEWANWERLAEMGVTPPRTCMIFGAPGTGKTHLAYHIAGQLRMPLVLARLDGLVSSFLGTTARNLGTLFEFCNRYRCLLLLDEFDAIAKVRDDPQEVGEIKRVVNTLLQNIDNRANGGLTIAITNHESLLDKAVWRRFEIRLALPLPEQGIREEILKVYLPPLEVEPDTLRFLAWLSAGMSGSDIKTMTNSMKRQTGLENGDRPTLFELARRFALTHAGTSGNDQRLTLLSGTPQCVARAVMSDETLGLTQEGLAAIMGKDQTTISRWVNKETVGV